MSQKVCRQGFTLAELLIALAILGVIATFTIPKVLFAASSGQNTAIAKETAAMIAGAYASYKLEHGAALESTTCNDLLQYINYVKEDWTSAAADIGAEENCSLVRPCFILHNGGVLQIGRLNEFGGIGATNAILFNLDPDGPGPAGRTTFVLFHNGRLSTLGAVGAANISTTGTSLTSVTVDPAYIQNWN
jgi:prepilin-type N-terminal cleavage/methylation domain-containing protein